MSNSENPWKTLAARTVYDNPWIRVEDHNVLDPNGNPGQYGKVCFKSSAIAILPIDTDDHTWLVGQYRYTLDSYSWELPMGGSESNESAIDAAQRELQEETGLTGRKWRHIMQIHTSNSVTDEVGHVFIATDLTTGDARPDPTEHLIVERVPFASALERVIAGEITDAISCAAILRAAVTPELRR